MKKSFTQLLLTIFIITLYQNANAFSETAIANQINTYRQMHHLPALQLNDAISLVAKQHSIAMAQNKISFGHAGFNERVNQLFSQFKQAHDAAENVAYIPDNKIKDAVNLWLKSAGHRKNIEGNYNLTGIGMAMGKDKMVYITQIFLNQN